MEKMYFVNQIIFQMQNYIDNNTSERLKNVIISALYDIELTEVIKLPSVNVLDNESILQRYVVDMIASNREKTTINQYLRAIRNFLDKTAKPWNDVTDDDITTYLAIRTVNGKISANYKDTLMTYIGSFYSWAYRKNYVEKDIMKSIDRVKRTKKRIDRLTDDEVAIVKGIQKDSFENALMYLMLECGLRISEISDLKIENIDWKNGTIEVWAEKTNETRFAFLTPDLEFALKKYICERMNGYLFISKRGMKVGKGTLEDTAKKLGKDAGCHCDTTVHIFRKTFASIMYRKTHDILLVSKLLGHKDTAVTIRCYLKDDIDDIKYRRLQIS